MSTDACGIVSTMSKKTKRQKIIADQRRSAFSSFPIQKNVPIEIPSPVKTLSVPPAPFVSQNESLYIYPVHLIRKDLTKTLILSILAISLEVALFLILERHLILPFRI